MRTLKILTTLALLVVVSAFAVKQLGNGDLKTGYGIGDVAEDFWLENINNTMMGQKSFPDAKGFIVIFTCNTCPFSVANEDTRRQNRVQRHGLDQELHSSFMLI